jgi:hypothetical protein
MNFFLVLFQVFEIKNELNDSQLILGRNLNANTEFSLNYQG